MARFPQLLSILASQRLIHLSLSVFVFLCFCVNQFSLAQPDLLDTLSLQQRVAQMFIVNLYGSQLTEAGADFLTRYQPGGVVLLGDNISTPAALTALINSYQHTSTASGGLPLLVAVDQEGGPISHLKEGFTAFPTPALVTASQDVDLAHRLGAALAEELLAVGVNMDLAPVADLQTNPRNPIIKRRSFGSSPTLVSPILGAFVAGMQGQGVLATAKHFPGHGDSSDDSHTALPVIPLDRTRLEAVELAPFRAAIKADVSAIMVAHIWYPALEPQENLPASLSVNIIDGLLHREMGYDGLVMTDALDMDAIDTTYSYSDAVLKAIEAGVDLVIAAHVSLDSQIRAIQAVVEAVQSGRLSEERINQSVRRILAAKARYRILNWQPLDSEQAATRLNLEQHARLVDELFEAGVTVARDTQQYIPLTPERFVAIIYPASRPQIMRECSPYNSSIHWVGVSLSPQAQEITWAQDAAMRADVVIVFTQNADEDPQQAALVNALPSEKTIAVALWSPYDWTVYSQVAGYVVTYSPLPSAISAACKILFGILPARGHLSLSIPGLAP